MSAYELAQLNVAIMREPLESPGMADFVANLARINALAEDSAGFVWRLQTEEADTLINISVWRDADSLNEYVYKSAHAEIMRRRKEWFERMREAHVVLWWVRRGHRPGTAEAIERLELLRAGGPTQEAFTLRRAFPAPDARQ
jgi:heme-degrading monooxygenase HmoA